jgi:hypothetical protein
MPLVVHTSTNHHDRYEEAVRYAISAGYLELFDVEDARIATYAPEAWRSVKSVS